MRLNEYEEVDFSTSDSFDKLARKQLENYIAYVKSEYRNRDDQILGTLFEIFTKVEAINLRTKAMCNPL